MASIFAKVSEQYGDLVNFIIRPPRDSYADEDLGPPLFSLGGRAYKRTDLELINRRNMRLQCSHYEPLLPEGVTRSLPCVIYLHGNCSSRVEALSALPVLLPQNITVFALDFSGSGRSDGPYISLGWWERDDLDTVIEHLRSLRTVSAIGLWGRSMGAVTALMHAHRDPSIGGMVLDSPFASLRRLSEELADVVMQFTVPKFVLSILLNMVRNSIMTKAQFDINHIAPMNHVAEAYIPALFVYGKEDTFISPQHVKDLYAAYNGDKNLLEVEGGHNSPRPAFMLHSAAIFFRNTLSPAALAHGPREQRQTGSSSKGDTTDNSSELCSNASSAGLVVPLHPFAETPGDLAASAAAADTAHATPAAAAVAGTPAAGAYSDIQQQQQQQQREASAAQTIACDSASANAVSGHLQSMGSSPTAAAGPSNKRRPWRSSSSSNSSKKEGEPRQAERADGQQGLLGRSSFLSRGLLRWGSGLRHSDSATEAAAAAADPAKSTSSGSSTSSSSGQRQARAAESCKQPAAAAGGSAASAAGSAAAGPAAARMDAVGGLAPPVPSFRFFNTNAGLEPSAFIEDQEDEILQRAISISLEEFIKEQQAAAEAAARDRERTCPDT
ncbi:hypothetical protein Efla_000863 [Eimeria flavescens]